MSGVDAFANRPIRWPLRAAALAALAGLAMLATAAWLYRHASGITAAQSIATTSGVAKVAASSAPEPVIDAPPYVMHLSDMRALFRLASERRLTLPSVDYQTDLNRPAGLLIKRVVLRIDDEYPKVKSFVAELLRTMPHGQLDEIQIEQPPGPASTGRIQATVHLSLVYRPDEFAAVAIKHVGSGP